MRRQSRLLIAAALTAILPLTMTSALRAGGSKEETKKLIEVLQSDKGIFDKAKACQRLAVVGTVDAVPVLAGLLGNKELAHYARFGLEPIPDPSVDDVLRAALGKLEGDLKIGVINSIGMRRDVKAQDALLGLLRSDHKEMALAAAAALGRIGTPEAAAALQAALAKNAKALGRRLGEAAIVCGEVLGAAGKRDAAVATFAAVRKSALPTPIRAAAMRGEVLVQGVDGTALLLETIRGGDAVMHKVAYGVARELPGKDVTAALVAAIEGLPQEKQAQILRALADRGDPEAVPGVLKLADEGPTMSRVAAIRALEKLGDASAVPRLAWAAIGEDAKVAEAALATLAEMGGEDVDGATLALLDIAVRMGRGEQGAPFLRAMVDVVGSRKMASSVRLLRTAADLGNETVRLAAIRALGTTVGLDDFGALVERLAAAQNDAETAAVRDALGMASRRMPSPAACSQALAAAMKGAPAKAKAELLGVFSAVGGPEAINVVAGSAGDSEAGVRHAALAALGNWPREDAVFKLLEIVPKLENTTDGTKAYQSFQDIVKRLGFDKNRRIGSCVTAIEIAKTDDERKIAIGALAGIPAPKTLNVLKPHLKSATLGEAAAAASVTICERLIRTKQRGAVGPAMKNVLAATKNPDLVRRAKSLAKQAASN